MITDSDYDFNEDIPMRGESAHLEQASIRSSCKLPIKDFETRLAKIGNLGILDYWMINNREELNVLAGELIYRRINGSVDYYGYCYDETDDPEEDVEMVEGFSSVNGMKKDPDAPDDFVENHVLVGQAVTMSGLDPKTNPMNGFTILLAGLTDLPYNGKSQIFPGDTIIWGSPVTSPIGDQRLNKNFRTARTKRRPQMDKLGKSTITRDHITLFDNMYRTSEETSDGVSDLPSSALREKLTPKQRAALNYRNNLLASHVLMLQTDVTRGLVEIVTPSKKKENDVMGKLREALVGIADKLPLIVGNLDDVVKGMQQEIEDTTNPEGQITLTKNLLAVVRTLPRINELTQEMQQIEETSIEEGQELNFEGNHGYVETMPYILLNDKIDESDPKSRTKLSEDLMYYAARHGLIKNKMASETFNRLFVNDKVGILRSPMVEKLIPIYSLMPHPSAKYYDSASLKGGYHDMYLSSFERLGNIYTTIMSGIRRRIVGTAVGSGKQGDSIQVMLGYHTAAL